MAILKMKKLRLMAVRSKKEALLQELIRCGCVEFSEIEEEMKSVCADVKREQSDISTLRSQLASLNHAIELLDSYAPKKSPLLAPKPEKDQGELLSDIGIGSALRVAEQIEHRDARIKRISAEESRERGVIESLLPWLELDMSLDTEGTERCSLLMGTFPVRVDRGEIDAAISGVSEEAEMFVINSDSRASYAVILCLKTDLSAMQDALRPLGFTASNLGGLTGTPRQCKFEAERSLKELAEEKESCAAAIVDESVRRDEMKLAADRVSVKIALCEANDRLFGTDSAVVMEGWFPEEAEEELVDVFERFGCAYEITEPEEAEYPDVPVKLKNNRFTNALNMVTNMYSLPAYGSLDPNPLMAPFFILFYGLMMADMGYGLIMILAAVIAMVRIKPREGTLSFCQLLLYGGISTFVCGALTGGFFGDALQQVGQILGKPEGWGTLPCLFSPLNDTVYVLIGAMVLGLIHLNTGMAINFYKRCKRGQLADAIWEEGALWVTLLGGIFFALDKLDILHFGTVAGLPILLIIGVAMVFIGGMRGSEGFFGKLLSIFVTLYNTATGWFGDILSYSRIMALMLAGSVIATVFNTIGGIAKSMWLFVPVFIIGHGLNFALNLLGCYVHDLRLQCLEYFGKFYEDGGRAFDPLKVKTKYYNVSE